MRSSTLDDAQPRLVCRTAAVHPVSLHTGHMAAATTQILQTWLEGGGLIEDVEWLRVGTPQPSSSVRRLNIIVCCFQNISWLLHRLHLRCVLWPTISLNHCHNAGVIQPNDCFSILHAAVVFDSSVSVLMPNRCWYDNSTRFQILYLYFFMQSHTCLTDLHQGGASDQTWSNSLIRPNFSLWNRIESGNPEHHWKLHSFYNEMDVFRPSSKLFVQQKSSKLKHGELQ